MTNLVDVDLTTATINDITARYPQTITVFNDFGVDACCGGHVTLADAATRDGVSLPDLTAALRKAIADADATART
jgi:iron-sulfur cluster repair protein YtfE (RIC family)